MCSNNIKIIFIPREVKQSNFDWVDIFYGDLRVGQARCEIHNDCLTIYSIFIYQEFQGKGYGRMFVEAIKSKFTNVTANRVRYMAIGFWESLGFYQNGKTGDWCYSK